MMTSSHKEDLRGRVAKLDGLKVQSQESMIRTQTKKILGPQMNWCYSSNIGNIC